MARRSWQYDTVMNQCVRRYEKPGQRRKHKKYGIKKSCVLKIHHDISTLKFEVVDILYNNGMKPQQDNVEYIAGEILPWRNSEVPVKASPKPRTILLQECRPKSINVQECRTQEGSGMSSLKLSTTDNSKSIEHNLPSKTSNMKAETKHNTMKCSETIQKELKSKCEVQLHRSKKTGDKSKPTKAIEVKEKVFKLSKSESQKSLTHNLIKRKLKISLEILKQFLQKYFYKK